jgi:hypothetical protein
LSTKPAIGFGGIALIKDYLAVSSGPEANIAELTTVQATAKIPESEH